MNRVVLYTWQNILRNKLLSLGVVSVVMLVSFFLMILDSMGFLLNKSAENAQKNVDFTVFLSQSVNIEDAKVQELVQELRSLPSMVSQISRQQAIKEAEKYFTDDLIGFVKNKDLLPASLVLTDIGNTTPEKIYAVISKDKFKEIIQGGDDRTFLKEQTQRLTQFSGLEQSVRVLFIVLYILFTLVAVLIIFNTIRLMIHSRSEELEIMELVGAEKNFIRVPFFAESMFLSAAGVFLGVLLFSLLFAQIYIVFATSSGSVLYSVVVLVKEFLLQQGIMELAKLLLLFMGGAFLSTRYAVKTYLPNM